MKVLVLNAGSSSLKFQLYTMPEEKVLAKGIIERIGLAGPVLKYESAKGKIKDEVAVKNHRDALRIICAKLVDSHSGVIASLEEINAVGHRVVNGGASITEPVVADENVKRTIEANIPLSPLHNPPNLDGIRACEEVFPGIPNVAVFDTAFHQTMPERCYRYAIPREIMEKYGVRKYGFHGTSHKFVSQSTLKFLGKNPSDVKMIVCHLGNGSSLAAIKDGKVLDTSMGMTPLDGLVMGSRCGTMDPAVVLHLLKQGMTADEIDSLLNKKSGFFGLAEICSGDMRDVLDAEAKGSAAAHLAVEMFLYRLAFYIGGYFSILGGADVVVLTGGIGENCMPIRARLVELLVGFGAKLDLEANKIAGQAVCLTTKDSRLQVLSIPTNEELMIARETVAILGKS